MVLNDNNSHDGSRSQVVAILHYEETEDRNAGAGGGAGGYRKARSCCCTAACMLGVGLKLDPVTCQARFSSLSMHLPPLISGL
jgi:hypothetical protein